jgi:hypothetical protein
MPPKANGIVFTYYSKFTVGVNDTSCHIFPRLTSIAVTPAANSTGVNYASDKFSPLPHGV